MTKCLPNFKEFTELTTHNMTSRSPMTRSNYSKSHVDDLNLSHEYPVHAGIFLSVSVHIWYGHMDAEGLGVSWNPEEKVQRLMSSDCERWVSNESWQWQLNWVKHSSTTKLAWLWMRRETLQWGGGGRGGGAACSVTEAVLHKTSCHFCLSFTDNTRTGAFDSEIYVSAVWFPLG